MKPTDDISQILQWMIGLSNLHVPRSRFYAGFNPPSIDAIRAAGIRIIDEEYRREIELSWGNQTFYSLKENGEMIERQMSTTEWNTIIAPS